MFIKKRKITKASIDELAKRYPQDVISDQEARNIVGGTTPIPNMIATDFLVNLANNNSCYSPTGNISDYFDGSGGDARNINIGVGSGVLNITYANFANLPSNPTISTRYERYTEFTNSNGELMRTYFFKQGVTGSIDVPPNETGSTGNIDHGKITPDALSLTVKASQSNMFEKIFGD